MRNFYRGAALAALAALTAAPDGEAATARLVAVETGFTLTGEIIGFDGASYLIDASIGRVRAPAAEVACEGAGCPTRRGPDDPLRILAASAADLALAARLVEAAAAAGGGVAEREIGVGESLRFRLFGPEGDPALEAEIERADAASAYAALAAGTADLVFAGRPPDAAERARPNALLGPLVAERAAREPLALLVAPEHPLRRIRPEDAARLFAGEIRLWSELGGPEIPVRAIAPAAGPAAEALSTGLLAPAGRAPGAGLERVAELRRLGERVAADPAAIGFGSLAAAGGARPLALAMECGLAAPASRFAAKAGDWPFAFDRWIVSTARPPAEAAARLLDFAISDAAEVEIADLGLGDRGVEALPVGAQGDRLAGAARAADGASGERRALAFLRAVSGAERLSATFRFAEGEAAPGPEAETLLARIARRVAAGATGRELLLIGFAEEGGPRAAGRLSEARAESVATALRAALDAAGAAAAPVRAMGLGDAAPIACRGDPLNRRVEVWLR